MKSHTGLTAAHAMTVSAVAPALLLASSVAGGFEGPYAPDLWSFTTEADGFVDTHTADTLVLVGGDSALQGDTDLVITAVASGTWSFHWAFNGEEAGFDNAYYMINDVLHLLSIGGSDSGSVSVSVDARDVIGFRVDTLDGIFGPGTLTITDFSAPVPGASPLALLAVASLKGRRRR